MTSVKDRLERLVTSEAAERYGVKTASIAEYSVDPGYLDAQQGMQRAIRSGDKGVSQFVADSQLIGDRIKGQLVGGALGGVAGTGLGALAGAGLRQPLLGAGIGGLLGAGLGSSAGQVRADVNFLRERGINPKLLGLAGARFTPEAAERYGVKAASIAEYSVLFDKIADGDFGEETRHALLGICDAVESTEVPEKIASAEDLTYISEDDARKARLDQLLKR